jgi:nucleoside recognition membrane protein YjiH
MVQVMACKFIFAYFVIIATKICNSSCHVKFVCVLSTPIGIEMTIYCDVILCSLPKIYQFVCVLSTPIGIKITIYCGVILYNLPKIYQFVLRIKHTHWYQDYHLLWCDTV